MADNKNGEIQEKIDRFTRLLNDSRSTEEEKSRYRTAIEKLKAMKSEDKKDEPEPKKEEKKTEPKKEVKKPEPKKEVKKAEPKKEEKKSEPKKGMVVLSSKRVTIDGKEVEIDSQEFCDYLTAQWRARREKAEQSKTKKKKTTSVMAKVSANIERGIATAIKTGIKENKVEINKNPKVFIGKVEKLETATKKFLENLKEVLGDEFDAKEVTSTTKAIQEMISELKAKYSKK